MNTNEIRERLSKITPGKWMYLHKDMKFPYPMNVDFGNFDSIVERKDDNRNICPVFRRNDADFIANAPTDIAFLLGEVERLTAEIETIEERLDECEAELQCYQKAEEAREYQKWLNGH